MGVITVFTRRRGDEPRKETFRGNRPVSIGRSPDNDVMLLCSLVSKHHATAHVEGDAVVIRDLGSVNGTYVNGLPARQSVKLARGDRVHISDFELWFATPDSAGEAPEHRTIARPPAPSREEAATREAHLAEALTRRLRAESLSREAMLRVVDAMVDIIASSEGGQDKH